MEGMVIAAVRYECPYRKQSGVYGRDYQLFLASDMSCPYRKQSGCIGANISYCSRQI